MTGPIRPAAVGMTWLLVIAGLALVLRVGNALWLAGTPAHFLLEDAQMYWGAAETLRATGTLGQVGGDGVSIPITDRVPGYILFVAAVQAVAGAHPLAVALVQAGLDTATCVLIALLGGMLTPGLGRLGGLLAAVWPNLIIHSGVVLTETLFLLLFTTMLLFCARFLARARLVDAAAAALLCGLALMVRPVVQFLPAALAVAAPAVIAWHARRHRPGGRPWRRLVAAPLLVVGLGLLPASPLIGHNLATHGTVSLTDQGGTHLLYWVVPRVAAAADGTPHAAAAAEARRRLNARLSPAGLSEDELPPFVRSRAQTETALTLLAERSPAVLAMAWARGMAINLAAPALAIDPRVRALPHRSFYHIPETGIAARLRTYLFGEHRLFGLIVGTALAAALATSLVQAWGCVRLLRQVPWAALFGGLCIAYFLLLTGPVVSPKYRLPVEPILILWAAAALLPRRHLMPDE